VFAQSISGSVISAKSFHALKGSAVSSNQSAARRPVTVRVARWSATHPWRAIALWLVFVVSCIAVALPGIDPFTTMIEMVPLVILYELSIWLSVVFDRRDARMEAASLTDP